MGNSNCMITKQKEMKWKVVTGKKWTVTGTEESLLFYKRELVVWRRETFSHCID